MLRNAAHRKYRSISAESHIPSVSLVIPCYNEASRLSQMWEGITLFLATWPSYSEFILVDDGSTDDSAEQILQYPLYSKLAADGRIQLLQHENTGKGGALAYGVRAATAQYILTLDADMATMPTELLRWLKHKPDMFADDNAICIGSRTHPLSNLTLTSSRRESGKLFNSIVRLCTGMPYRDTQCGFKLYPQKLALEVFSMLKVKGWSHDIDILMQLRKRKITVYEMPIAWNEQDASKIRVLRDGMKMLMDVVYLLCVR